MVRDLQTGQYELRLFLVGGVHGHGARPWGILLPESIPRNRLRDLRRELERARRAKAQSARLLERVSGYRDAEAMGHRM
jgi:hypothetical protein